MSKPDVQKSLKLVEKFCDRLDDSKFTDYEEALAAIDIYRGMVKDALTSGLITGEHFRKLTSKLSACNYRIKQRLKEEEVLNGH